MFRYFKILYDIFVINHSQQHKLRRQPLWSATLRQKMSIDNNIEMVKKAMDLMKMQGETVLKLIEEQKQANESFINPEGVGKNVDVYA